MKIIIVGLFFILSASLVNAQRTTDIMVGGGFDLFKTDNRKLFDKGQVNLEANYFVARHFAVGAGAELWTANPNSFVMGMRWYADDHFFGRLRGLIGANDVSVGAGWSKPIMTNWRFEALADFYFHGDFGLRVGVAYILD
jgi:hypothetical protein